MSDNIAAKLLGGNGTDEARRELLGDFIFVGLLIVLKDYCDKQSDPQIFKVGIVDAWKQRIIRQKDGELEQLYSYLETPAGMPLKSMYPSREQAEAKFAEAFKAAVATLEKVLL